MAALKWALVALFSFASLGALAMGLSGEKPTPYAPRALREVSLREFPGAKAVAPPADPPAALAEAPKPAAPAEPVKIAEAAAPPEAPKPAEPAKTPEPVKPVAEAPKPPEPVKPVALAEAPKTPPPAPVAKAPEAPKPVAPAPIAKAPEAPKPVVVAAAPKPPPAPAPAKAEKPEGESEGEDTAPPEGILNLRASDTAEVFLDGKKLGGSPVTGIKVAPGKHKVRFDCYDASGGTVQGTPQTISVPADGEKDVEFECPAQ